LNQLVTTDGQNPHIGFQDRPFQPLTHPSADRRDEGLARFWVVYNRREQSQCWDAGSVAWRCTSKPNDLEWNSMTSSK
jgi:hypothetical protein